MDKSFKVLSQEGDPQELVEAIKPLAAMGLMNSEQRTRLMVSAALGKGEPITFHEASLLMKWAFRTLSATSVLEGLVIGNLDVIVDEKEENFSFGLTELGQQKAEEAIATSVMQNEQS